MSEETLTFETNSLNETELLGQKLAQYLPTGTVIALIGTLGAGKTKLVQAVANALDVEQGTVSSPTFVLIHEYEGSCPIYHFDAYRLNSEEEFMQLGPDDYFEGTGLTFVEWADKFPHVLPKNHLEIQIEITGETQRKFVLTEKGQPTALLQKMILQT